MDATGLLKAAVSGDGFAPSLKQFLEDNGLNASRFSELSGIPQNTLYKILSGERTDFRISTLRQVYRAARKIGHTDRPFVALITSRAVLDNFRNRSFDVGGEQVFVKDYPATSIEDEIVAAVRAERDGAMGVMCGPVAASTVQQVLSIPIVSITFTGTALKGAISSLKSKIR